MRRSAHTPSPFRNSEHTSTITGPSIQSALLNIWRHSDPNDRALYLISAGLALSGLAHLGVQLVAGGSWDGPVSWRKPTTFGLTLATLTWVTSFIRLSFGARRALLAVFALACIAEVAVITLQAWRGVPSHFNVSTPLNATLAYTAAAGGAVIVVLTLVLFTASLRPNAAVPPSMRLAVRAGFLTFLSALAIGVFMIALGVTTTRTVSQAAAYTVASAFKAGHAATMHGILILPTLAWLTTFTLWTEGRRVRVVTLACAAYVLAAGTVVVDVFTAINPLSLRGAPLVNTLLGVAGALGLLIAYTLTLLSVRQNGSLHKRGP